MAKNRKLAKMLITNFVTNKKEVTKTVTSGGIILQEAKIQEVEVIYLH